MEHTFKDLLLFLGWVWFIIHIITPCIIIVLSNYLYHIKTQRYIKAYNKLAYSEKRKKDLDSVEALNSLGEYFTEMKKL